MNNHVLQRHASLFIWLLFLLSRFIVLIFPPPLYSDVRHDYERYANMWWYGMEPYLEHYYEYPPATIPLLIFPLLFDQLGLGKYYFNYRIEIFLVDVVVFYLIIQILRKLKRPLWGQRLALGFYVGAGLLSKDFYYEGIDLAFIGSLAVGLMSLVLLPQQKLWSRVCFWFFFWVSFALKFLSLPLLPVLFLLRKTSLKTEILACTLGCLLVWGAPMTWYRSSLQVAYVFHKDRPLKYSSFGSYLIEVTNAFTHSEKRVDQPPDFAMSGPVAKKMNRVFGFVFPVSILLLVGYWLSVVSGWSFSKWKLTADLLKNGWHRLVQGGSEKAEQWFTLGMAGALTYIATIFLTGKIFSQPFVLWFIPLLTLFPFRTTRQQAGVYLSACWVLVMFTTPWIHSSAKLLIGPFSEDVVAFTIRILSLGVMMVTIWRVVLQGIRVK